MPQAKYRVSLKLANNIYTKIAPSIIEALDRIKPEGIFKTKGVITVSTSGLKSEIMLFPFQLKRLFINNTAKEIFQKRMIGALK